MLLGWFLEATSLTVSRWPETWDILGPLDHPYGPRDNFFGGLLGGDWNIGEMYGLIMVNDG